MANMWTLAPDGWSAKVAKREDWCRRRPHGFHHGTVASSLTRLHISAKITPWLAPPASYCCSHCFGKMLSESGTGGALRTAMHVSPWQRLGRPAFWRILAARAKCDLHTNVLNTFKWEWDWLSDSQGWMDWGSVLGQSMHKSLGIKANSSISVPREKTLCQRGWQRFSAIASHWTPVSYTSD